MKDENELEKVKNSDTLKPKSFKFLNFLLIVFILIIGIFLYIKYLGVKGLIVKEYRVESSILSSNFSGIKIVHISDILYGSTVDKDDLNNLVKKVNLLKPDIIVFTGDLVHKTKSIKDNDKKVLINILSEMDASIGKYAIKGNYDYNEYYEDILNESKFILLDNSYEEIYYKNNEFIYIVGLPSMIKGDINLEESFKFYTDEDRRYIICLLHEGNMIDMLNNSDYEIDLILGGHSLNGSIIVPYYGSLFIPKDSTDYYAPVYSKGITNIFISSGIGTDEYPYRFMNKPSINLIRLKSNE